MTTTMKDHPIVALLTEKPWVTNSHAARVADVTRERSRQIRDVIRPADRPDTLLTALVELEGPYLSIAEVAEDVHSRSGYLLGYANAYNQVAVELARLVPGDDKLVNCSRCRRRMHRWELAVRKGNHRTAWCRACDKARLAEPAHI